MITVLKKVKKFIDDEALLRSGDRCLIALSGGADSVALLKILYELKREYDLTLYSMHVHHGIRDEEADRDAKFSKELSESFGIECIIKYIDVPKYAKANKLSTEEAARILRYEELHSEASLKKAKIVTAHHLDDKAETFILNLCRGSGLKGLGSIRAGRDNIIRPLLGLNKSEILDYTEQEKLDYVTDSTNLEVIYTRNYIRHKIIPGMEKINACAQRHISCAGDEIYEAYKYIKDIADKKLENICVYRYADNTVSKKAVPDGVLAFGIGIEKDEFNKEADIIQNHIIYAAFERMVKGLKDVSSINIKDISELSKKSTGKQIHLPHNFIAYTDYKYLWLEKRSAQKKAVKRLDSKPLEIDNLCRVEVFACDKNFVPPNLRYTKYFDADKLDSDIKLRYRQPGDHISIKSGKKSLKSFMTDEKIPADIRDGIKLIACGSHVLWVIGYRISEYYKINENTKNILKIRYLEGDGDNE
jgi:tRNA(ile)-lysidine synthetase